MKKNKTLLNPALEAKLMAQRKKDTTKQGLAKRNISCGIFQDCMDDERR